MHFYCDGYKDKPHRFGFGETTRSYDKRHKDGDYGKANQVIDVYDGERIQLGYWEDQSTRSDGELNINHQDHVVHAWLAKDIPGVTKIGSETFEVNEDIVSVDVVVQMIEEKWFSGAKKKWKTFKPRPYQQNFLNKISKAWQSGHEQFLLFAKCRAGKSVMTLQHIVNWDYKFTVVCSRFDSPQQSWRDDSNTFFPTIKYISVKDKNWEQDLEFWMERPVNVVLWATVQSLMNREIPQPDLLVADECHVGSTAKQFTELKERYNTKILYLSGTAYSIVWDFKDDNKFVYSYFDEQLDSMNGVFEEPRPMMLPTIKVYDTPAYRKIFGSDPDSINNTFLIDKETDKFLNPELPRDFAFDNFDPKGTQREVGLKQKIFQGRYMMMALSTIAACHEFKKIVDCWWPTLVVTSDTGNKAEEINKFIDSNPKALILTSSANVLGFTNEKIDTIINCKGGESLEFWNQFAFRGGSGKHNWHMIDFNGKRALKSIHASFQLACDNNPELRKYHETQFMDLKGYDSGFRELTKEEFDSILSSDIDSTMSTMESLESILNLDDVDFNYNISTFATDNASSRVLKTAVVGDEDMNNESGYKAEVEPTKKNQTLTL